MTKNTISVSAHIITGGTNEILINATPHDAIENYLCPDMRPPVETIVIKAKTDEGKTVTISVTQNKIYADIE